MEILSIVVGLGLLGVGAEVLVRGGAGAARALEVSPLLVGLVLVGFGTSTPELVTSVGAALAGSPGIALGNVVGSNIANILLILGLAATLTPLAASREAFRRDGSALLASAALVAALCWRGSVGRGWGVALLALLAVYVVLTYRHERRVEDAGATLHRREAQLVQTVPQPLWRVLLLVALGLGMLMLGARLLVDGAVDLAAAFAISETLVGLTVVAVGTSLPELATSTVAALRSQTDVALGNIVGSNLFNSLGILGAAAVVQPLAVPRAIATLDAWVMLGVTAALLLFLVTGLRLERWEGGALLIGYAGYLAARVALPG